MEQSVKSVIKKHISHACVYKLRACALLGVCNEFSDFLASILRADKYRISIDLLNSIHVSNEGPVAVVVGDPSRRTASAGIWDSASYSFEFLE
jgi:hypothetical protein